MVTPANNGVGVIKYQKNAGSGGGKVLMIVEADRGYGSEFMAEIILSFRS
jgi:hypothetical protein